MKLALLTTNYDLGGAAIVTQRLTRALREQGVEATMVVARPGTMEADAPRCIPTSLTPNVGVHAVAIDKRRWWGPFLRERAELWGLDGVRRRDLFKVSTGFYGVPLEENPIVRDADAVVVSWASQGFLSLASLRRILDSGKRVIYIMHDLWAATALCHLPGECRRFEKITDTCDGCPYLNAKDGKTCGRHARRTLTSLVREKRDIFHHPNLRLVAVSRWQAELASRSAILGGYTDEDGIEIPAKEIEIIPHPFPIDEYQPGEKAGPDGRRTIVMAAARLDDPVKDLPTAIEALNILRYDYPALAENVEVLFVGAISDPSRLRELQVPYRHLGPLSSVALRNIYARATVVLSSSRYETMGATLMEGMACGAIPVTFGEAGQRDIVTDGVNGFIAPAHTPASLALALRLALEQAPLSQASPVSPDPADPADPADTFTPAALHASVATRFSPAAIARRFVALINGVGTHPGASGHHQ